MSSFWVFLPAVLLGFGVCSRLGNAASVRWLLLASFVFYGYWNPTHLPLIAASILVNFQLGKWLASEQPHRVRRFSMLMGVALNLGLIAYFKYFGFFADVLASVSGQPVAFEEMVLPLGISFFYHSYTTEPLLSEATSEKSEWLWEPAHYKVELDDRMLERIYGLPTADPNLGVRLTSANVDVRLKEIVAGRQRWLVSQTTDARWVTDLVRSAQGHSATKLAVGVGSETERR